MRFNRRTLIAAGAALVSASFFGPAHADKKPAIEFLYSPYADYAPFFIAKERGYFDDQGVDVTLTAKGGTAETIQMLASGHVQAGAATWGAGLFNSIQSGATVAIGKLKLKLAPSVSH